MMNEAVAPVAPAKPIAPPGVEQDASMVSPVASPEVDLNTMYEDAAESGDPVSMYSLSSRLKGTPMEEPIKRVATTMHKNLVSFEEEIKPAIEAGGASTPQGRIAVSKTFESIADKPQKMRAFVEMLMGNPKWRTFVTGGTPDTKIVYDNQGNMIEKTVDETGRIISIVDSNTGTALTREQLAQRGGLVPTLQDAIGYQKQRDEAKFNVEALNKANAATNEYAAKAPELKARYQEMQQRLQNLYGSGLNEEQRKAIGQFTTRSMGYSQSLSDGFNAMRQKVDNKNVSLSAKEQKSLGSALEAAGFKIGGDGSIVNSKGEAVSKQELDQAQKTASNGSQFEKNFTQSKDDFIRSSVFSNLGEAEMKNLGRVLDLQGEIEKTNLELASKHGTLPFLMNPKSYELGDEFSRGQASALIGEFNSEATQMFANWREQQLAKYPKGKTPSAGELEAAFAKTAGFKELRESFAEKNRELLRKPGGSAPAIEANPIDQWSSKVGLNPETKPRAISDRRISGNKPEQKSETKPISIRDAAKKFGGRD